MATEREERQRDETELEHRLRELRWPGPPPGVRERVLGRVRAQQQALERQEPAPWHARRAS